MKRKRIRAISLIVLGIAVILLGLSRLSGAPDAVVRTLGVVVLLALPVAAFATVRLADK